jgi:hypothetical protein
MINEENCPICGRDNNCHACTVGSVHNCWCMSTEIPKALLDMIPEEYRENACVCKKCVDNFNNGMLSLPELFIKFNTCREIC